jgi:hypothetical protein
MKKQDKKDWFDSHVIITTLDDDKELENKIRKNLKEKLKKKANKGAR